MQKALVLFSFYVCWHPVLACPRPASPAYGLRPCRTVLGLCPVTSASTVPARPRGPTALVLGWPARGLCTLITPRKWGHAMQRASPLCHFFVLFRFFCCVFNGKSPTWGWLGEAWARPAEQAGVSGSVWGAPGTLCPPTGDPGLRERLRGLGTHRKHKWD